MSEVRLPEDASPAQLAALRERLTGLAARVSRSPAPVRPFLLVTPFGLEQREAIEAALVSAGVAFGSVREPIAAFAEAATALYVRALDEESLHRAIAFEIVWKARWGGRPAERWALASPEAYDHLVRIKHAVRAAFPSWEVRITTPKRAWVARLHAFHVSDPDQLAGDSRMLDLLAEIEGHAAPGGLP